MQKIFSSMMAAMGRQLKQSVKVFHSLMLYLRLPAGENSKHRGSAARVEVAMFPGDIPLATTRARDPKSKSEEGDSHSS